MGNSRLKEMIAHAGERMALDLRQRLIPHRGEQGVAREEVVRAFLRDYLPKRFEVSTGFIFDADGLVSEQIDIIIADSLVAPRFEAPGGIRFYPCEAVVAAGEVKTHVTTRRELWDAIAQLRSVSLLDRSANGRSFCYRTGEPLNQRGNYLHRIFTFVMILDRAPSEDLTTEVLTEVVQRSEHYEWPNIVVALQKYLVTYACDGGVCPNTEHARGIATVSSDTFSEGSDTFSEVLMRFYLYLSQALAATSVAQVSSWAYLGDLLPISGSAICATTNDDGEPPPYLSTLNRMSWTNPYDYEDDEEQGVEP